MHTATGFAQDTTVELLSIPDFVVPTKTDQLRPAIGPITWIVCTHLLGIAAIWYTTWFNVLGMLIFYFLTGCLGITLGFHRLLTHRSFKTRPWIARMAALFGTLSMQGGPGRWVAHHRMHHAHSDTPGDPHNAKRGFWYSHMVWLFRANPQFDDPALLRRFARDIYSDPFMAWLDKTAVQLWLNIALAIVLFAVGGIGLVLWAQFARMSILYHGTWFVNSACHKWGYQNYDVGDLSRNCWWVAVLSWGEGWHNNHHAHPHAAPAGHKPWEIDPTYAVIRLLARLNLAWDVKLPVLK